MTPVPPDAAPMSVPQGSARLPPPGVVPTLTEVIDWPGGAVVPPPTADDSGHGRGDGHGNGASAALPEPVSVSALAPAAMSVPALATPSASASALPPALPPAPLSASTPAPGPATSVPATRLDDEEIVDNVLAAVQSALAEADGPLDQRLRDILEPALARFAEALVADVRADFAAALRDVAAEAVVQELGRYRRG